MGFASPARFAGVALVRSAFFATLVLLAVAMAAPAQAADYENKVLSFNPLGYWKLDETASANDAAANSGSIGTSLNGSYGGYASRAPVAGALDQDADAAQSFNGSANSVSIPYNAQINRTTAQTWSAEIWAKPAAANPAGAVMSSGLPADPGNRTGWVLYQFNDQWSFRPFKSMSNLTVVGDANGILSGSNTVILNAWQHLVVVNDGTNCLLYVNGVLKNSFSASTYVAAATGGTTIGRRFGAGNFFNGSLDEAAFYPTALSAAQILAHYNNGIARTTAYDGLVTGDGAVAYYRDFRF